MEILLNFGAAQSSDEEHSKTLEKTGFWGKRGAGCLVLALDTQRILIGHRSSDVLEPNTWGTFGGALDGNERPDYGCERELIEETGYSGVIQEFVPLWTFKDGKTRFEYHNFLCVVAREFNPVLNWENQDARWVGYTRSQTYQWPRNLHRGMKQLLDHVNIRQVVLDIAARYR